MQHKKKIYVAYTGGTIGMQKSHSGYVPVTGFLTESIAGMPEFYRDEMPEFDIVEYDPLIDSSNMTPDDWQRIANDIRERFADYDGFVILHGTDTMAFTASALSFMFEDLSKPVIVTGSQIPLSALRSDGQVNLLNALFIAANYPIAEVGLFFNNTLFRGNRSTKAHADGFAAFDSPNSPPMLEAGIDIRLIDAELASEPKASLNVSQISHQPIGVISLYPGISAEVIKNILRQPVKALILQSYGVGNAPEDPKLLQTLAQANAQGIVVLNLTQCFKGKVNMEGYATGQALQQVGVISGQDLTLEAALTKLHYLLSKDLDFDTMREALSRSIRKEISVLA